MITRDNWQSKLDQISREITNYKGDLLLLGGKYLEGEMKQRIFNKGLASSEIPIGQYKSKFWKKKRSDNGYQINYVDLELTGSLRNSIQVVQESNSETSLAIINDDDYDKAMGQELIQGKKIGINRLSIFYPSITEQNELNDYINDLIDEKIDEIIARL